MITDFSLPDHERELLDKIVERAAAALVIDDVQSLDMDLTACHKYDTALDLERMLTAPIEDFRHDVLGISRYIDRKTGRLTRFFAPRLAKPCAPAAPEKTSYAFTLAAEIVSEKAFKDIPKAELIAAMRARLDALAEHDELEAFSCFDEMPAGT